MLFTACTQTKYALENTKQEQIAVGKLLIVSAVRDPKDEVKNLVRI